MAGGEHFGEEGHVEPAQGDFVRSKYPAFAIEDDCFIGGEAAGVAHRTGIDDHAAQAHRLQSGLHREGIEAASILVSFGVIL